MLRRPRRNRKTAAIRDMLAETKLSVKDLIYPLFLIEGTNRKEAIRAMPNIFRYSSNLLLKEIADCLKLGINSFVIFPVIAEGKKDKLASAAYDAQGLYAGTLALIKAEFPTICLMTDLAMDPYSIDGHDGIYRNGHILNDETLAILGKMALVQAAAGADILGPSDMMDGRVGYLRKVLDENGFTQASIMSYTAKYASAFYGPFRDALGSSPKKGDKKTYQMDTANSREALIEAQLDIDEGADFLLVKPALAYLDIILSLRRKFQLPIAAYNVSGIYAMIKAAQQMGWIDGDRVMVETLLSIKRAGADIIITYFAKAFATKVMEGY